MNKIPFALGTAAGIAASEQIAAPEISPSARGQAVFAGLVVAKRGRPYTVLSLNSDNLTSVLGEPIHPRTGNNFEPIRHLKQATTGGRGYAVRVVPFDMRIPVIRLKETAVQPAAKMIDFDLSTCTLSADKSTIKGDGLDKVLIQFTAKDTNGSLLTGLKNVQFQTISQGNPVLGDVWEVNGTYFVEMTSSSAYPVMVLVLADSYRVGNFSVNVDVTPAIIDPDESTLTISPDIIDDDGTDFATVTLSAFDSLGNPVAGMTNVDFMINSPTTVMMSDMTEPQPGVYVIKVMGTTAGTMSIYPRQNKIVLAPLMVEVRLKDVTTNKPISDSSSTFDIFPSDLYGDGKDQARLTFTAMSKDGALIKNIPNLTFKVVGSTTSSVKPKEINSGVYEAVFSTTDNVDLTITPMEGTREITTLAGHLKIIPSIPIDVSASTLAFDKKRIVNNNTEVTVLTATLVGAGGVPSTQPRLVEFEVVKGQATLGNVSESRPGILTLNVTSRYSGDIEVIIKQYGVQLGTLKATVFSAPAVQLSNPNSRISADRNTIQENGTDTITLTFEAVDTVHWAMSGMTGLNYIVTGLPGGVTVSTPVETPANSGKYVATLTATQRGTGKVILRNGTSTVGNFNVDFTVTAIHGAIELPNCSFSVNKTSLKANNIETATATLVLKDFWNAPITGRLDCEVVATGLSNISISPMLETATPGTYTATLKSLSDGTAVIGVKVGGKALALRTPSLAFIRVRGIVDPSVSTFTLSGSPIADNGVQRATATFTAIDGLGNPITGLRVIFDTPNGSQLMSSQVNDNSGIYTATLTGRKIGTYTITVEIDGTAYPTLTDTLEVHAAPVVNMQASSISDQGMILADGQPTLSINVKLIDQYGKPIDYTQITLRPENLPGVTIGIPTWNATTEVLTFKISASQAFKTNGTLYVRLAGVDVGGNMQFSFHVLPAHGVIDPNQTGTTLAIVPAQMDADGKTKAKITLMLMDGYGARVTGIASDLDIESSITSGVTISGLHETGVGLGVYTAEVTATVGGTAIFTATRNGVQIGSLEAILVLNNMSGIISGGTSSMMLDKTTLYSDTLDKATITLTLKDALGRAIVGKAIDFVSSPQGVTFSPAYMTSAGVYVAEATCNNTGNFIITPRADQTEIAALAHRVIFRDPPALAVMSSSLTASSSALADGMSPLRVTFSAVDQYGNPLTGLTGLSLRLNGGNGIASVTAFTDRNDGTYTSFASSRDYKTPVIIELLVNGTPSGIPPQRLNFVAVPGVYDADHSSVIVNKPALQGDGADTGAVRFSAKDGYDNPVTGMTNVTFELSNATTNFTLGQVTEVSAGVYQASYSAIVGGTYSIFAVIDSTRTPLSEDVVVTDLNLVLNRTKSSIASDDQSYTAVLAERTGYTPTANDRRYVEAITVTLHDVFDKPLSGLTWGAGGMLELMRTSGTVDFNVIYDGEISSGVYRAYIWSRQSGNFHVGVKYKGADSGITDTLVIAQQPIGINWTTTTLTSDAGTTIDLDTQTTFAMTMQLKDTLGDALTGYDVSKLSIALASSVTGLSTAFNPGAVSEFPPMSGIYHATVAALPSGLSAVANPVYAVTVNGVESPTPTLSMTVNPKADVLSPSKSVFELDSSSIDISQGDFAVLRFTPHNGLDQAIQVDASKLSVTVSNPDVKVGKFHENYDGSNYIYEAVATGSHADGTVNLSLFLDGTSLGLSVALTVEDQVDSQATLRTIQVAYFPNSIKPGGGDDAITLTIKDTDGNLVEGLLEASTLGIEYVNHQYVNNDAFIALGNGQYKAIIRANGAGLGNQECNILVNGVARANFVFSVIENPLMFYPNSVNTTVKYPFPFYVTNLPTIADEPITITLAHSDDSPLIGAQNNGLSVEFDPPSEASFNRLSALPGQSKYFAYFDYTGNGPVNYRIIQTLNGVTVSTPWKTLEKRAIELPDATKTKFINFMQTIDSGPRQQTFQVDLRDSANHHLSGYTEAMFKLGTPTSNNTYIGELVSVKENASQPGLYNFTVSYYGLPDTGLFIQVSALGVTLMSAPISIFVNDEPDNSEVIDVVVTPGDPDVAASPLYSTLRLVSPEGATQVMPGEAITLEFMPYDDQGKPFSLDALRRLQYTVVDGSNYMREKHQIVDASDPAKPCIKIYGKIADTARGEMVINLLSGEVDIVATLQIGTVSMRMFNVPNNPLDVVRSILDVDKKISDGDGEKISVAFIARDFYGMPLPGLRVGFTSSNPLFEIGLVVEERNGIYLAECAAHSFDYITTIQVTVDGLPIMSSLQVVVRPQDIAALPTGPVVENISLISSHSDNTLYPIVVPADGRSQMVATLSLVDAYNAPVIGANVQLVLMEGSITPTVSPIVETAPGEYQAVITSDRKGPVILSWYCDGVYIRSRQRGAFAAQEPVFTPFEEPEEEPQAEEAEPRLAAPAVYIQVSKDTIGPEETLTLEPDDLVVIAANDGDDSTSRSIVISRDVAYPNLWDLVLYEYSNMGIPTMLEMVRFSLDHNEVDKAGKPMWLPLQLEATGSRLTALVRANSNFPATFTEMQEEAFVGGYAGTLSSLTPDDYRKALKALEMSTVNYTAVLSLGIYDQDVLTMLAQHARDVRVDMFADVPPAYDPIQAMQFAAQLGLGTFNNVALYHFPYSSRDVYTGDQVVYGLSGDAFLSKARGVVQVKGIGGWHYSPAGETRGNILRRNIQPLFDVDEIDREEYVRLRINPVKAGLNGMTQIDDALTTYMHDNGLHYQHVSSVMNALARDMFDICSVLKHEPGERLKSELEREIPLLMNEYVRCGALVMPTDTMDDPAPYKFSVVNTGFDSWHVRYAVCVVGTARRIMCEVQEIR